MEGYLSKLGGHAIPCPDGRLGALSVGGHATRTSIEQGHMDTAYLLVVLVSLPEKIRVQVSLAVRVRLV